VVLGGGAAGAAVGASSLHSCFSLGKGAQRSSDIAQAGDIYPREIRVQLYIRISRCCVVGLTAT
jgi:hypothetical protein